MAGDGDGSYEPPETRSAPGLVDSVVEAASEEATAPVPDPDQAVTEEPQAEPDAEPDVTGPPVDNELGEEGSVTIEVDTEQKNSFGSRRIIKVPCNGNARPDRNGQCRNVW